MNTYLEEGRFANSAMQFHIGSSNFYGKNSRMPIATFRLVIIVQAKAEQNFIFRNRVNTKTNYGSKLELPTASPLSYQFIWAKVV